MEVLFFHIDVMLVEVSLYPSVNQNQDLFLCHSCRFVLRENRCLSLCRLSVVQFVLFHVILVLLLFVFVVGGLVFLCFAVLVSVDFVHLLFVVRLVILRVLVVVCFVVCSEL